MTGYAATDAAGPCSLRSTRGPALQQAAAVAFPRVSIAERRMARAARDLPSLVRPLPNGVNLVTLANGAYRTPAVRPSKGGKRGKAG